MGIDEEINKILFVVLNTVSKGGLFFLAFVLLLDKRKNSYTIRQIQEILGDRLAIIYIQDKDRYEISKKTMGLFSKAFDVWQEQEKKNVSKNSRGRP